jgi:hypothetical protein
MVADDEDFVDWQRDWLAENGRGGLRSVVRQHAC